MKLIIFQPNVRPYRVGLFEGVGLRYPGQVKICAAPCFDVTTPCCEVSTVEMDYTHRYTHVLGLEWQHGFSISELKRGDVIVICGEPRNLSMMWVAFVAKVKGVGVVWWGLHKMPQQNKLNLVIRKWLMFHLSDTILFYNKTGIKWLNEGGYDVTRVYATGNTINQKPIKEAISIWTQEKLYEFQQAHDLIGKRIILACSRIIEKHRLHEMIEALAHTPLNREDTILVVIGDGPLKRECENLADRLGVSSRIRWLGSLYSEMEVAPWFLVSKAFTYPGPVGLAILKSLSYGLPVVINDTHNSTEAEVMEDAKTGYLFKEFDTEDLAQKLDKLMSNEVLRTEMSEYSKKVAYENYSMDKMVENFCNAVEDARKIVSGK